MYNTIAIWLIVIIDIKRVYGSKRNLTDSSINISQLKLRFTKPNVRSNQQLKLRSSNFKELSPRRCRGSSNDQKPYQRKKLDLCNSRSTRSKTRSGLCYSAISGNEFGGATCVQNKTELRINELPGREKSFYLEQVEHRYKELLQELLQSHMKLFEKQVFKCHVPDYRIDSIKDWEFSKNNTQDKTRDIAEWLVKTCSDENEDLEKVIIKSFDEMKVNYKKVAKIVTYFLESFHMSKLYHIKHYFDKSECTRFYILLSEIVLENRGDYEPFSFILKDIEEWNETLTLFKTIREDDKKFMDDFIIRAEHHIEAVRILLCHHRLNKYLKEALNWFTKNQDSTEEIRTNKPFNEKEIDDLVTRLRFTWDETERKKYWCFTSEIKTDYLMWERILSLKTMHNYISDHIHWKMRS